MQDDVDVIKELAFLLSILLGTYLNPLGTILSNKK